MSAIIEQKADNLLRFPVEVNACHMQLELLRRGKESMKGGKVNT
jgi:hypothetical protein